MPLRSTLVALVMALAVWGAVIAFPGVCLLGQLDAGSAADARIDVRPLTRLFVTTAGWAALVAAMSVLIGWAPGRWLGGMMRRRGGRGYLLLALLMLVPIMLPSYVVYYAWWQSWPPQSWVFQWAAGHDLIMEMRYATLVAGLVCWSWPLVAWCVAATSSEGDLARRELLLLDGVGRMRRGLDVLRQDAWGMALGAVLVFTLTFNNTVCFDLAWIYTFGFELRTIASLGGSPALVLQTGWPTMAIGAIAAAVLWFGLSRAQTGSPLRAPPSQRTAARLTIVIWLASVVTPLSLFAYRIIGAVDLAEFWSLYDRAILNSLTMAGATGAVGALSACVLMLLWIDERRWVRWVTSAMGAVWVAAALVPGTVIGVAMQAAYNRPPLDDAVYTQPWMLVMGYLARYGFAPVLLARWAAAGEPRVLRDVRRIDGVRGIWQTVRSVQLRMLAAAMGAGAMTAVFALGDIAVTARLQSPRFDIIAPSLLNFMHFQQPESAMLVTGIMMAAAIVAAAVVLLGWMWMEQRSAAAPAGFRASGRGGSAVVAMVVAGVAFSAMVPGCAPIDPEVARDVEPLTVFGIAGTGHGQFNYPRGIAVDGARERVFVVDKTGRVQRFGIDGEPEVYWHMPRVENGYPNGLGVHPDGRVFVADTHYHRVMVYSPDGALQGQWGALGEAAGEFIYLTDVAFHPDGRVYVSEYGGNDRVQIFHDDGTYVGTFGSFGPDEDQFNRPQAMAFTPDGAELYIADACNHRIVVTDPEGRVRRTFGGPGRGAGQLNYPYDVTVLTDGTVMVAEFGNNRVQHLGPSGEPLGIYGRRGFDEGEWQYPWGVDSAGDRVFVLDSGNNRVQVIAAP